MSQFGSQRQSYREASIGWFASGGPLVGIDSTQFKLEYPFQALLRERMPQARFVHTGVKNTSARYQPIPPARPCAVVCLMCGGVPEKRDEYRSYPRAVDAGSTILFFADVHASKPPVKLAMSRKPERRSRLVAIELR